MRPFVSAPVLRDNPFRVLVPRTKLDGKNASIWSPIGFLREVTKRWKNRCNGKENNDVIDVRSPELCVRSGCSSWSRYLESVSLLSLLSPSVLELLPLPLLLEVLLPLPLLEVLLPLLLLRVPAPSPTTSVKALISSASFPDRLSLLLPAIRASKHSPIGSERPLPMNGGARNAPVGPVVSWCVQHHRERPFRKKDSQAK